MTYYAQRRRKRLIAKLSDGFAIGALVIGTLPLTYVTGYWLTAASHPEYIKPLDTLVMSPCALVSALCGIVFVVGLIVSTIAREV